MKKKDLGPYSKRLEIPNSTALLFGNRREWQPDKIYFIHSETCHYHIYNIHEHKTYWSKRISTEKEKTSILDVIQSLTQQQFSP